MEYQTVAELVLVFLLISFAMWRNMIPSLASLHDMVDMLNTKGGNIALLAIMALVFFKATMHLAYVILDQIEAKTLREDNAIALMALQFCTTGAFGGAMGAMLTMMTGEPGKKPVEPPTPPVIPPVSPVA
jgi:hypothetical protein